VTDDNAHTQQHLLAQFDRLHQRITELEIEKANLESELEASRSKTESFQRLCDSAPIGIFITDPTGNTVYANSAAVELTGQKPEEVPGFDWMTCVHPDDRGAMEQRLIDQQKDFSGEFRILSPDGTERSVHACSTVARTPYGEVLGRVCTIKDITERKRALQELAESEARYRSLVEHSIQGVMIVNEDRLLFINRAFTEITGYTLEELQALPVARIHEMFHAAKPSLDERKRRIAEGQYTSAFRREIQFQRHDGRQLWLELHIAPTEYNGRPAIQKTFVDVTPRKETELELRARLEELNALRAASSALTASLHTDQVLDRILLQVERIVEGDTFTIMLLEAGHARIVRWRCRSGSGLDGPAESCSYALKDYPILHELARTGNPILVQDTTLEQDQPIPEHGQRCCSYIAAPIRLADETLGFIDALSLEPGYFDLAAVARLQVFADQAAIAINNARLYQEAQQEIAERRRVEAEREELLQQVRRQERVKEEILLTVPEGMLVVERHETGGWRLEMANPLGQQHLARLAGQDTQGVFTHLGNRPVPELLAPPTTGTWHEVTANGTRSFDVLARRLRTEPGTERWVMVVRDTTNERELQRMIQQQERLAAVGQLAGGIAHDFNNFLTTIILYAQMPLHKPDVPPNIRRSLETILSESRKAATLIQQILDFSRQSQVETQAIDLEPFIKEAVKLLKHTIPENIQITDSVDGDTFIIEADPTRIQQVLMNLAVNARDAIVDEGEIRIGLSRVTVDDCATPPLRELTPGEWICLSVTDTGPGIPPDVLPHIFEPFFTTKPAGRGTGLGLSQIYGIVQQHHGHIGVETQVGRGTTFRIYLPASAKPTYPQEDSLESADVRPVYGKTVLVVEDDDTLRAALQDFLEGLGYDVLTAEDGRNALEMFVSTRNIDLIITDILMPNMTGRHLVRELRSRGYANKVLGMTGYLSEEDAAATQSLGFVEIIDKPFDMAHLAEAVRHALDDE